MSYHSDYWNTPEPSRWTWRGWLRVAEHLMATLCMLWAGILMLAMGYMLIGWLTVGMSVCPFAAACLVRPS